jgi:hypothetical protein
VSFFVGTQYGRSFGVALNVAHCVGADLMDNPFVDRDNRADFAIVPNDPIS